MSESLRQIGQQAEENYSRYKDNRIDMPDHEQYGKTYDERHRQDDVDGQAQTVDVVEKAFGGESAESLRTLHPQAEHLAREVKNHPEFMKRILPTMKAEKLRREAELVEVQRADEDQTRNAAIHYQEHAGEYHDLAKIEAHLDGVKINVSQPLEIGEPVEVHHN